MYRYIRCPNCRCEYLPGEIFNPDHFLGQPKNIIRNAAGEVLGYEGVEPDTSESFICENCNTEFKVTARINFLINTEEETKFEQISLF